MAIHGHPWISMDIHGYPQISMDIHGHLWISMNISTHQLGGHALHALRIYSGPSWFLTDPSMGVVLLSIPHWDTQQVLKYGSIRTKVIGHRTHKFVGVIHWSTHMHLCVVTTNLCGIKYITYTTMEAYFSQRDCLFQGRTRIWGYTNGILYTWYGEPCCHQMGPYQTLRAETWLKLL